VGRESNVYRNCSRTHHAPIKVAASRAAMSHARAPPEPAVRTQGSRKLRSTLSPASVCGDTPVGDARASTSNSGSATNSPCLANALVPGQPLPPPSLRLRVGVPGVKRIGARIGE